MTTPPGVADLVDAYQPLIRVTASRLYPLLEFDDAYQEIALAFLEALRDYDPGRGVLLPWHLKVRCHWAAMRIRRKLTYRASHQVPLEPHHDQPDPLTTDILSSLIYVAEAVATATPHQRHVLATYLVHALDPVATAQALDITPRAVNRMLQRLRAHLKNTMRAGSSP